MADASILKIKQFLGLNENPDGDTKIKTGELSAMRNFRITQDGHLQIRPGSHTVLDLRAAWESWRLDNTPTTDAPALCGIYTGRSGGGDVTLASYGGVIWRIVPSEPWSCTAIGTCTQDAATFFGFGGNIYLLNGHEYKFWDGGAETGFAEVEGYVPVIGTAYSPAGSGTLLERVNRLCGKRRIIYSPDGSAKVFHLPEQDIDAVTAVEGTDIAYTVNAAAGTLSFASAPPTGTNTVTVTYKKGDGARGEVAGMRYSEVFNGVSDSRVFLYGDGSNKAIYSGLDYDGNPTADYFPDLSEMAVGESNEPITGLVRHFTRLLVFKPDSLYSVQYGTVTLADGSVTAGFYVTPTNRILGNEAMGQVKLLENNPVSLCGSSVYEWRPSSSSGSITQDERTAKRISDRLAETFRTFDFARTVTYNDRYSHEFWFLHNGEAAVLNYVNDTWYKYNAVPYTQMFSIGDALYGGTADGKLKHLSRAYRNDDGAEIDAYAATGAMDFDRGWMRKFVPMVFVAILPESNARVTVTAESNRKSDYPEKVVSSSLSTLFHADFAHWSFHTNRKPQVKRLKLKVKKATFYKLIFKSRSSSATATVLEADVQLRYSGNVK